MANLEHVKIVRQGANAIREWQEKNQRIILDLERADLSGLNLEKADLSGANLFGASLFKANLFNADLSDTNLWLADLSEADLFGVNLARAHIYGTSLWGSELSEARCSNSIWADCDLSTSLGLEKIHHRSHSSIGVDTLVMTLRGVGGNYTPEQVAFFKGAGVPETLLGYLSSLLETSPLQFYSCFISYGEPDKAFAERLYHDLVKANVKVWWYPESAVIGRGIYDNIGRAITVYDKLILVCSKDSLERPSVLREMERALQKEDQLYRQKAENPDVDADVLFPIRLDNHVLDGWSHERRADVVKKHIGDFTDWDNDEAKYQRELQRLIKALDPRNWAVS